MGLEPVGAENSIWVVTWAFASRGGSREDHLHVVRLPNVLSDRRVAGLARSAGACQGCRDPRVAPPARGASPPEPAAASRRWRSHGAREAWELGFGSGGLGTLYMMQACHPIMRSRGGGSIVNFGSSTAITGDARFAPYVMTKEAVRGRSRVARASGAVTTSASMSSVPRHCRQAQSSSETHTRKPSSGC